MSERKSVTRTVKWVHMDTGEQVATTEYPRHQHHYSPCPQCGQETEYNEFQIDQDEMGNDIDGAAYECWHCHIMSEPEEL